jgi:hypothetical protein
MGIVKYYVNQLHLSLQGLRQNQLEHGLTGGSRAQKSHGNARAFLSNITLHCCISTSVPMLLLNTLKDAFCCMALLSGFILV